MCGIFGYIQSKNKREQNPITMCLNALKRLEYRGYDSAGIAGISQNEIVSCKTVGKVSLLEEKLQAEKIHCDLAIAHTRWATHGRLTIENAHPQFNDTKSMALVHNGIIENYYELRATLEKHHVKFSSDTDTETLVQLISYYYKNNLIDSLCKAIPKIKGSFAFALIHKDHPDVIVATARHCPLVIGIDKSTSEILVSSDQYALGKEFLEITYVKDDEIAYITNDTIEFYNPKKKAIIKTFESFSCNLLESSKAGYEHYMLKEIHEQPQTFRKSIEDRYEYEFGTAKFDELTLTPKELLSIKHILILGCGTSWHAGCIAASMIESLARIPTQCEIASEFRYTDPIISENTLVLAISQSGETADTLAAVKEVKAKGAKIISICNVTGSSITRESDCNLLINAGPEISVCSTKAFTSQLGVLSLLTLYLARLHHMKKEEGRLFLDQIKRIPFMIEQVLLQEEQIKQVAEKYSKYNNFFFLGRRYMYPTSLEAALKLKEISYINACGYPAGEMKHGPIALINENFPVVGLCGNLQTIDKMVSNLKEIEARHGPIIAFAPYSASDLTRVANDIIWMPSETIDELSCIPYSIATQLFAYYVAKTRGTEIDQPRNLAKSVTVE